MRRKNEIVSRKYIDHVKCILDVKDVIVIIIVYHKLFFL